MNSAVRVNTQDSSRSASGVSTRCSATMRPGLPAMTRMRSARRMASIRSWVIISTAQWRLSRSSASRRYSSLFRPMSRAEKASSSSSRSGCTASARASAARLCMPPDRALGYLSRSSSVSPMRRASAAAVAWRAARGWPAALRPSAMLSRVRFQGSRRGCWNIMAGRRKLHSTQPSHGESRPAARLSRVVLPQPEGPTRATASPGATRRSMSSSTRW